MAEVKTSKLMKDFRLAGRDAGKLKLFEDNVVKKTKTGYSFYKYDKGKLKYSRRWMSQKTFDKLVKESLGVRNVKSTYRKKVLPKGFQKIHMKKIVDKSTFKLQATGKKHTTRTVIRSNKQLTAYTALKKRNLVVVSEKQGVLKKLHKLCIG